MVLVGRGRFQDQVAGKSQETLPKDGCVVCNIQLWLLGILLMAEIPNNHLGCMKPYK